MSITPGLIIYCAKKYHAYPQVCRKYRLTPNQLDYNLCNLKSRKGRLMISKSHYISKVSHSVNLSYKILKGISQLSAQPSYLRRLRLGLCWPKSEEQISRLTRKVLKKFFSKAKRVASIEIELEPEKGFKTSVLEYCAFLRSLKNMRIRSFSSTNVTFQGLQSFLFSNKTKMIFPHFQHAYLQFELKSENVMGKEYLDNYLLDLSEALHRYQKSQMMDLTNFKFRLPLLMVPDLNIYCQFIQSLVSLPNVVNLGHGFQLTTPPILSENIVNYIKDLKVLDLCLPGPHTELLPQIIQKAQNMKSLRKLVIWIRKFNIKPVKTFFGELKNLQQIDWFTLNCENCVSLDDDAMNIMGQSLEKLKNLKTLQIKLSMTDKSLTITSVGLERMLQSIGKMSKLKELYLLLNGFETMFSHKLYQTIWTSLKMLKELTILGFSFAGTRFEENDLALFEKYFKRSSNLQSLTINFQGLNPINSDRLSQFIRTFASLKRLKMLVLKLTCTELNEDLISTLTSTLYSMKSLDSFSLNLLSERDQDTFSPFEAFHQVLKLEDRMQIAIERI